MDLLSGVTLTKQCYDLLKVIIGNRDTVIINQAVGELREKITDLQMLNSQLASQSANYEMHKTPAGSIVYRSKLSANDEVNLHYLCAHCYQNRVISILQPTGGKTNYNGKIFSTSICHSCDSNYLMDYLGDDAICVPSYSAF
ncbi:MAG: hypothetical protein ACL7AY_13725 [Candidatus Arsenophonus phytopathogenicus]